MRGVVLPGRAKTVRRQRERSERSAQNSSAALPPWSPPVDRIERINFLNIRHKTDLVRHRAARIRGTLKSTDRQRSRVVGNPAIRPLKASSTVTGDVSRALHTDP